MSLSFAILKQVVLYHMCETYSEKGVERIGILDLGTGAWNFLLVALGGTIIGQCEKYRFQNEF